jgi:2-succinyl-6-hydroxy-2,4-cyclohexadiene-1-carboxylate synthase
VLVHGFTQTGACWGPIDVALADDHEVVAVDAPGHGRSTGIDTGFDEAVDLLGEAGGAGDWIGYSMGGRLALALAVRRPGLVGRLVLVGASPGVADDEERAARRAADDALAEHLERIGVPAFLDEWLAQPLFAGLTPTTSHREARLVNTAAGLASSLRRCGTGAQPSLWPSLGSLSMPVLLVAGATDAKFVVLAEAMAAAIGDRARVALVAGAGHTAHLEQPERFLAVVAPFLRSTP